MFTLMLGGRLDRFMGECKKWQNATSDQKSDGCFFLRSFMIAIFKWSIGLGVIAAAVVGFWVAIRYCGEIPVALWLGLVHDMTTEQIKAVTSQYVVWFWFVPHIFVVVWAYLWFKFERWFINYRSERRWAKAQAEADKKNMPAQPFPFPTKPPSKVWVMIQALAGKVCFKINVVK